MKKHATTEFYDNGINYVVYHKTAVVKYNYDKINPNTYVVIYASGLDPALEESNNNTSFKLTQTRGNEYIINRKSKNTKYNIFYCFYDFYICF